MVNAIPGRNSSVLDFDYHLPKPWTNRYAHVNGIALLLVQTSFLFLWKLWTLSIQPKLSKNMETAANGTEISGKGSRNSENCWISETRKHLTKNSRNSRSKVEWKENFRENCVENWGIPREVVLFLEILENVIPFANGSCWKFKADVLVEWKAPNT